MASVSREDDPREWEDLMAELDRDTGIVIRTADGDKGRLVCDYMGKTIRRIKQISDAERQALMDNCEETL